MNDQPLLTFPCSFQIKIMGINHQNLIPQITAILTMHAAGFNPQLDMTSRMSSKGNYLSITATIMADSKQQLDDIYYALNKHELVKITL
jgi:putative lipoic acid-binding regulatory protein